MFFGLIVFLMICLFQEIDSGTPKKERDDALKLHKDRLMTRQKEAEIRLEKQHKDSIDFEIRKFRRRKLVQYHSLEKEQLQEVSILNESTMKFWKPVLTVINSC